MWKRRKNKKRGQIERFFKVLGDRFSFKNSPNFWWLSCYFENINLKVKLFLSNLWWRLGCFFKMAQTRHLLFIFVLFLITIFKIQFEKSVPRCRRMVGTDTTTELWRPLGFLFSLTSGHTGDVGGIEQMTRLKCNFRLPRPTVGR